MAKTTDKETKPAAAPAEKVVKNRPQAVAEVDGDTLTLEVGLVAGLKESSRMIMVANGGGWQDLKDAEGNVVEHNGHPLKYNLMVGHRKD